MTPTNVSLTTEFGDGTYTFRLPVGQICELEDLCDKSVAQLFRAVVDQSIRFQHRGEVIRLALIGGGLSPVEALNLKKRYHDDRPILECAILAQAILGVALKGRDDDDEKKATAENEKAVDDSAEKSSSPTLQ